MSAFQYSVVLIIPAAQRMDANLVACALGHDVPPGQTFSVPLSENGADPATHYGCHTWAQQALIDLLMDFAQTQSLPQDAMWEAVGLSMETASATIAAMVPSVSTEIVGAAHFEAVLTQLGLQNIQPELPGGMI